jgi:hypothetical protein
MLRGGIWLLLTEEQVPKAKKIMNVKAKGRLPSRDVALSIRFVEDPVRHPDRNASGFIAKFAVHEAEPQQSCEGEEKVRQQ